MFSAGSASFSCHDASAPIWGQNWLWPKGARAFPGLTYGNNLLLPPFAPLRTEESACVYSGGFTFIDQFFGVFVEDKACKLNQWYWWKGLNNSSILLITFQDFISTIKQCEHTMPFQSSSVLTRGKLLLVEIVIKYTLWALGKLTAQPSACFL